MHEALRLGVSRQNSGNSRQNFRQRRMEEGIPRKGAEAAEVPSIGKMIFTTRCARGTAEGLREKVFPESVAIEIRSGAGLQSRTARSSATGNFTIGEITTCGSGSRSEEYFPRFGKRWVQVQPAFPTIGKTADIFSKHWKPKNIISEDRPHR